MLENLARGRDALAQAVNGVSEEMAVRRPGEDRWSILQCVEHVAVVEDYLFGQIGVATAADTETTNLRRERLIRERAADRSRKIEAPAEGRPTGRFATLAGAMAHFLEARAGTIRFVECSTGDLRMQVTGHPILGQVNCYETLLMISAHPHRHAGQIAEIRSSLEKQSRD